MNERPKSITIISWVLIITGGISLITCTFSLYNPATQELMAKSLIPITIQYVMLYLGVLIHLVCGFTMLKRKNWGRLLYVCWGAISFIVAIAISPLKLLMIPSIVLFLIVVFFLFRPNANSFFQAIEGA